MLSLWLASPFHSYKRFMTILSRKSCLDSILFFFSTKNTKIVCRPFSCSLKRNILMNRKLQNKYSKLKQKQQKELNKCFIADFSTVFFLNFSFCCYSFRHCKWNNEQEKWETSKIIVMNEQSDIFVVPFLLSFILVLLFLFPSPCCFYCRTNDTIISARKILFLFLFFCVDAKHCKRNHNMLYSRFFTLWHFDNDKMKKNDFIVDSKLRSK